MQFEIILNFEQVHFMLTSMVISSENDRHNGAKLYKFLNKGKKTMIYVGILISHTVCWPHAVTYFKSQDFS